MAVKDLPKYDSDRPDYIYVDNTANFVQKMLKVDNLPELIAADTETYYNNLMRAPKAISKWIKGGRNNCPFGASFYDGKRGYWVDTNLPDLQPLLLEAPVEWAWHNSKFDINMLMNIGMTINEANLWDTMIMINLINEEFMCKIPTPDGEPQKYKKSKALKNLAYHFLGKDSHIYEDLVKEYRKIIAANTGRHVDEVSYKEVGEANPELMKDYAIADTEFTWKLQKIFLPMLQEQNLQEAYDIDIGATWAVVDIERNGYLIDYNKMNEDEVEITKLISEFRDEIYGVTGRGFLINSDLELVQEFKALGQEWEWFTEKEELCTDKKVLGALTESHNEAVAQLAFYTLEYRRASKILSTYILGIKDYIQEDGKVHPDFWVSPSDWDKNGTVTGRLSSSNPNLQNVKKKPVKFEPRIWATRTDIEDVDEMEDEY